MFHIPYLSLIEINHSLRDVKQPQMWNVVHTERYSIQFLAFFFLDFSESSWAFLLAASLLACKKRMNVLLNFQLAVSQV